MLGAIGCEWEKCEREKQNAHPPRMRVTMSSRLQSLSSEILGVELGKRIPLFRQVVKREDRRHRTHGHARAAIDTLDGIDIKQLLGRVLGIIFLGMNAIHRTRIHAGSVFGIDAGFCNYISHNVAVS